MAFLRRIRSGGRDYLYKVESYRTPEGKVRQRVLEYLGPVNPIYKHHSPTIEHVLGLDNEGNLRRERKRLKRRPAR